MPRVKIDDFYVLSYDATHRVKHWTALSNNLILKYGNKHFKEQSEVETILIDGFQFLVNEFRKKVLKEKHFKFFLYVFWLHEQSTQLYIKTLGGLKLKKIDENEFALYGRILKLILEQGCEIDLEWGRFPNSAELKQMDEDIQELLYLGTWMYSFANFIAFQKMVENCHDIKFDNENLLMVDWQFHYGVAYDELMPLIQEDYKKATVDTKAQNELEEALEHCFFIDWDFAGAQIFEIKRQLNPEDPSLQTIQPHVLPLNLSKESNIDLERAKIFYDGLTISRANKLSIEDAIYKPYSMKRFLFRPILIYNIGGEERALIGIDKYLESFLVLSTNALHWNALPSEWLSVKCVQLFVNKKAHEHDKILEDKIETIIKNKNFLYVRNIKTFKQPSGYNFRIDNQIAGEIDFIVVNSKLQTIFVADSKYNRTRYEGIGFRSDYTNFINDYEPQLQKKVLWVKANVEILQEHLKIVFRLEKLNLFDYRVEGVFFINSPTFYMFNGAYKAIPLRQIPDFIEGQYEFPELMITKDEGDSETLFNIKHPYFKKPIIIRDSN